MELAVESAAVETEVVVKADMVEVAKEEAAVVKAVVVARASVQPPGFGTG